MVCTTLSGIVNTLRARVRVRVLRIPNQVVYFCFYYLSRARMNLIPGIPVILGVVDERCYGIPFVQYRTAKKTSRKKDGQIF